VNYILEHALRWHVTSVNLQSSPIPADWKADFENFQKKNGTPVFAPPVGISQDHCGRDFGGSLSDQTNQNIYAVARQLSTVRVRKLFGASISRHELTVPSLQKGNAHHKDTKAVGIAFPTSGWSAL